MLRFYIETQVARMGFCVSAKGGCYEKPPPGLIKEDETKPEDCIPDVPGNEHAREFLAHAPTKGLWMPLGKEVKVMQCKWRNIIQILTLESGYRRPLGVSPSESVALGAGCLRTDIWLRPVF
uniref:Uncharacterized protein n=1 Tax=Ornithorhynchus anatinus TaxID=9258 RepID=A0A6I8NLC2_ORNAN